MKAIAIKNNIIKTLSSQSVFQEYYINANNGTLGSDLSLVLNNIQRTIDIKKIEFKYEYSSKFDEFYSKFTSSAVPRHAKIYFATNSTDNNYNNKEYVATISYSFFINRNLNSRSAKMLEFNVTGYKIS